MSTGLINPIVDLHPDYCYICNTAHVVDIYNCYDKPIGLTALLNYKKNIMESSKLSLKYGRCRNCGARFTLVWNPDGSVRMVHNKNLALNFAEKFHDFEIGEQTDAYKNNSIERLFRD